MSKVRAVQKRRPRGLLAALLSAATSRKGRLHGEVMLAGGKFRDRERWRFDVHNIRIASIRHRRRTA